MSKNLEVDSIVHLKSGSPGLRVVKFCEHCEMVKVNWTAEGGLREEWFPLASLVIGYSETGEIR